MAKRHNVTLDQYHAYLHDSSGHRLIYFEDFHQDQESDASHYLDSQVSDQKADALRLLMSTEFKDNLTRAIEALPDREKTLMSLYYEQDLNLKEIGAVMNITESRVSQLHSQAVARLRVSLKDDIWTGRV